MRRIPNSNFILAILNKQRPFDVVNFTFITIILKVKNAFKVDDFRPINLCNAIYKIAAKTLANRLKPILPLIISPNQSAFIPSQLIMDNIIIAFETLHSMIIKCKDRNRYMTLVLDMSKACNRIEWKFLKFVLVKMGFYRKRVDLVMACVSFLFYSILVIGQAQAYFKPTRGLRQGDPLSLYLFILCAESLSHLLSKVESKSSITSMPIGSGPIQVNYLFFADDC